MKTNLNKLALITKFLNNLAFIEEDEPFFFFDDLVKTGEVKLSDFKFNIHYKIDTGLAYETHTNKNLIVINTLTLTDEGYVRLLKKYPIFQKKVKEQWSRTLRNEIKNAQGANNANA